MSESFITIFSAMVPIGELRFAIPFALSNYDMHWGSVLVLAIVGNTIPVPVILFCLTKVGRRIEASDSILGKVFRWRTNSLISKMNSHQRYPLLTIFLLVAIPLPFTGAWTGSLAVWLSGISQTKGILSIFLGIITAGAIVTFLSLAGSNLLL